MLTYCLNAIEKSIGVGNDPGESLSQHGVVMPQMGNTSDKVIGISDLESRGEKLAFWHVEVGLNRWLILIVVTIVLVFVNLLLTVVGIGATWRRW